MKMRFAAVAAVLSCAAPAMAANITWTAPVDATGSVTDILNYGSIYAAARAGVSTTVNGVAFAGASGVVSGTMSFGAAPITLSGIAVGGYGPAGAAPESWDENYRTLLSTATYGLNSGSGFSTAINISGLTAGSTYMVQVFMPYWNYNWSTYVVGGANSSGEMNLGVGSQLAQSVTGTFVADEGGYQGILLGSSTPSAMFGAISVQALEGAVPEPASWAMMLAGFGAMGVAMRRKRAAVRFA